MNYKELQQIAKEVGAVIDVLMLGRHDNTVFTTGELERFAAIIEKRTIERCAVTSWNHYMETCKKHGHGPDVESIRDFCSAAAIRKLGEQ